MHARLCGLAVVLGLSFCGLTALVPSPVAASDTAALTPAPSTAASAGAPRPMARAGSASGLLGGLNILSLDYGAPAERIPKELAWAHSLHAKFVRVEVPWAVMEPNGPGAIDPAALAYTDRLVAGAKAVGMKVLMLVEGTPCWDSTAPAPVLASCSPTKLAEANAWPPRTDSPFAEFMAFLARRYQSGLEALEVWNEPDESNEHYLAGPNKAAQYVQLLRAAYPAIKQADPGLPVLGGSLVGSNGAFLQLLYQDGMKGYSDGLSVHFYNLTLASLRSIHEVQLQNGDHTPLWLNEFGYTSCWPKRSIEQEQACVTPQLQASDLASIIRSLGHTSYVAGASVYKLQDSDEEEFGMLTTRGTHKPSFSALAGAFASPFASPGHVTLQLRRTGGRVVASGTAPPGDFMQLRAYRNGALRYYVIFKLNRFNGYRLTLPAKLGARGLTVKVFQYSLGLGRAAIERT